MSSNTGAALTWLRVKTAATVAGGSETMSARSFLPDGLMPAAMPSARKPRAAVTLEEAKSFFIAANQIRTLHGLPCRASGEVVVTGYDDEPIAAFVHACVDGAGAPQRPVLLIALMLVGMIVSGLIDPPFNAGKTPRMMLVG